jgi:hypothetical protein
VRAVSHLVRDVVTAAAHRRVLEDHPESSEGDEAHQKAVEEKVAQNLVREQPLLLGARGPGHDVGRGLLHSQAQGCAGAGGVNSRQKKAL